MRANNIMQSYLMMAMVLCIVFACKKNEPPLQHATTFLKTYQTDSSANSQQLFQMPDGGFIIISIEGAGYAGEPLMVRTDKYGNFRWKKTIQKHFPYNFSAVFQLSDGSFVAQQLNNFIKFDTLGNSKLLNISPPGNLQCNAMTHLGSNIIIPACGVFYAKDTINEVYVYDQSLNLLHTDSFYNGPLGGKPIGFFVNNVTSTGTCTILGEKYPRNNFNAGFDNYKLFAARISVSGNTIQTIIDSGDQKYSDLAIQQLSTDDSGEVLLGSRYSSTISFPVVVRFDKNLNVAWYSQYSINTASVTPNYVSACKDGGFIIAGSIQTTGTTYTQPYALKIDANGNKQWAKAITSSSIQGNGAFYSVTELGDGTLAFVGGSSQFGMGLVSNQILFIKTDANGNL